MILVVVTGKENHRVFAAFFWVSEKREVYGIPEKSDSPMAENPLCLKVGEAPVDQVINNVSLDPT